MERVERLPWSEAFARAVAGQDRMREGDRARRLDRAFLDSCDDRALVACCIDGYGEAFDVIVERHRRSIYQLCYRFLNNHEDASDVAQEVFLRAYRGLKSFKGGSSLATWLYRIGVNACLNRRAARPPASVPIDAGHAVVDTRADPSAALLEQERAGQVREAIGKLPPKQRSALILRVYHDLSHQEIAEVLGSTVGAVKANFFHALQNLKRLLEKDSVS